MLREEERERNNCYSIWLSIELSNIFSKIKSLKNQSQILLIIEIKQVNSTNGLFKPRVIVKDKLWLCTHFFKRSLICDSSTVGNMDEMAATAELTSYFPNSPSSFLLVPPPLVFEIWLSTSEIFSKTLCDSRRPDWLAPTKHRIRNRIFDCNLEIRQK